MRVVYDYGSQHVRHAATPGRGRGETVLVVSVQDASDSSGEPDAAGTGLNEDGPGWKLQLSDEALARDREVRAHEKAHQALLGSAAASGIILDTATGPGGESVAVGGRIAVDLSDVPGDPEATLRKANAIIAAAYAPSEPSGADQATAARAYEMAAKAQRELRDRGSA